MVRRRGPRLTVARRAELWRRWQQGESLNAIGRALGRIPKMVRYVVAGAGGIPPVLRQRARQDLTLSEREAISRGVVRGLSLRQISRDLGRAPSTVSREVRRHGGPRRYRAANADRRAWARGRRSRSPAGCAERILMIQPCTCRTRRSISACLCRAAACSKKALMAHLRQRRTYRRPKSAAAHPGGHIVDAVSIRERPATVEDRAVPGHWEGDLLVGSRNSYIATLVERRSRYVCLVRTTGKDTQMVVRALTRHVQRLPAGPMATLTWDRGLELAAHRTFSIATGVQVFFCDPQSPWQRGTNENTNGLLRQYLPRRTDLSGYTQAQLDTIALRLNTRPRKTLGYRTPAVTLSEIVASTG